MDITYLADNFAISGQLQVEDLRPLKAQGFNTIVCNRPDGEAPGQPTMENIRQVAERHGLAFYAIPMTGPAVTAQMAQQLAEILTAASGKVLGYCRTGRRSSMLWQATQQQSVEQ